MQTESSSRRRRPGLRALTVLAAALFGAYGNVSAESGAAPATYYYFVFSEPVAGYEQEYNRWYNEQHAPDVVSVPGFVSARRFKLSDRQLRAGSPKIPEYLVVYKIVTDDLRAVGAEVNRRIQSGETHMSPYFNNKTAVGVTYRALGAANPGAGGDAAAAPPGPREDYYQFVFGDPVADKDAEFNEWYDTQHAPDVASVPGFVSWQRGQLSSIQLNPAAEAAQYVAMFRISTSDIAAVIAEFQHRAPAMTMSKSFNGEKTSGYTFKALGPELSGDAVRAARQRAAPVH